MPTLEWIGKEKVYFASPKSSKLQRKIPTPTWGNLASGG